MMINFKKFPDLLAPAIVQDADTNVVLMLGYMNEESLQKTRDTKRVTFFSRDRQKLWTKGETSGNYLILKSILEDCDNDTLLIKAIPTGPVCHTGNDTCFDEKNAKNFLPVLQEIIESRKNKLPENSYVASLFKKGIPAIAQKVGEEATEVVIEAMRDKEELFLNEAADLLFHYLVLLSGKGYSLERVLKVLEERHQKRG
ncbi:MAG: bifunctional phosphoribosyl-AMP cyclohydrolase/phosphoribosyl-ATP diphosphatase HisIE [Chitinophagaceae bacterium]|nr:bifunctional phosphoribosyl-AMP cyclohydrolase/phosphoribosyl-ATP diphosphatase HisIE [Chitinophagaceae bacterium]